MNFWYVFGMSIIVASVLAFLSMVIGPYRYSYGYGLIALYSVLGGIFIASGPGRFK